MKLNDFISKWNGKYVEVAGSANAQNQCVDLANLYIRRVWEKPIVEWTNARDFPSKMTDCEYVKNTPTALPPEGCLMVWKNTKAGHIAIFIEGDLRIFRSFDQNFPTGSPCHVQNHTYLGVDGWIVNNSIIDPPPIEVNMNDQTKLDLGTELGEMEIQAIRSTILDGKKTALELDKWKVKYNELVSSSQDSIQSKIQELKASDEKLKAFKLEYKEKLEKSEEISNSWKDKYQKLISGVAGRIGTTQNEDIIYIEIDNLVAIEDKRPIGGDNSVQTLLKALSLFFKNMYEKVTN